MTGSESERSSFRLQCHFCHQIGLFATLQGVAACGWALDGGLLGAWRGLKLLSATCWECLVRGK